MVNIFRDYVEVGDSKFGKGLFASANIPKGTEIFTFTGKPISFTDAVKLGNDECYTLQVGQTDYIFLDKPYSLANHSCDPNCGLKNTTIFVAIKDINIGEELFFDYSTSMLERHWTMICNCNTNQCRQIIDDFDKLPIAIKEYYKSLDVVPSFILNLLDDNT